MNKKRKRKFILIFILALFVKSCKANADLFAEGFALDSISSKPAMSKQISKCGKSHGILSRLAASAGSNTSNNDNDKNDLHFESSLNTIFERKQLQKKFKHAKRFGVLGDCNSTTLSLFREELIKHMKSNTACLGHYRGKPVYHYFNPDTKLNVMVDFISDEFISGWRLSGKQIEYMEMNGNIQ